MTVTDARLDERTTDDSPDSAVRWWALCVSLALALRIPFVNIPLGIDEGGDSFVARAWHTTGGSMYGSSWLDRPPLLVLLYKIGVLGGDIGVRMLGMAAAVSLVTATMLIARRVGGPRAAVITGLITAVMTSSVVLGAVFTNNELLATVPVTFSVVTLLKVRDGVRTGTWLFVSGVLAMCALLVKQSFGEALAAGVVFLVVSWRLRDRSGYRGTWAVWWLSGALTPLALTIAWFEIWSVGLRGFVYAALGFRLDSFSLLHQTQEGASFMFVHLGLPILVVSGCLLLAPWAVSWLLAERADPQLVLPLLAWFAVGVVGIMGGGNYYPHYFIQPLTALAVMAGCALAVTRKRAIALATAAALAVLAVGNVAVGSTLENLDPPQQRTLAVSDFLHANAQRDDSLYVLYARANLLYYADMKTTYPYAWSMMIRTIPSAEQDLRTMLRSPSKRPTWIVQWQIPTIFGLDKSGETRRLIADNYTFVDNICGIPILIRNSEADRRFRTPPQGVCARLDLPKNLGPNASRNPTNTAELLWQ